MTTSDHSEHHETLGQALEGLRVAVDSMKQNAPITGTESSEAEGAVLADNGEIQHVEEQLRALVARAAAMDAEAAKLTGGNEADEAEQAKSQATDMRATAATAQAAIAAAPTDTKTGKKRISSARLEGISARIHNVMIAANNETGDLGQTVSRAQSAKSSLAPTAFAAKPTMAARVSVAIHGSNASEEATAQARETARREANHVLEAKNRAITREGDDDDAPASIGKRATQAFHRAKSSVGAMLDDASENVSRVARGTVDAVRAAPRRIGTAATITASNVMAVVDGDEDKAKENALRAGRGARRALMSVGVSEDNAQTVGRVVRNVSETANVAAVTAHTGARGAARGAINESNELKDDLSRRAGTAGRLAGETITEMRNGDMRAAAGTARVAATAIGRNIAQAPGRAAQSADDIADAAGDRMALASKFGRELNQLLPSFQNNVRAFDADKDGKVELHEVKNFLARHGIREMAQADLNRDGDLAIAEIANAMRGQRPANNAAPNRPSRNG